MKKKGIICSCGKYAHYKNNLKFNGFDIEGWVCKHCGEVVHEPLKAEKILWLNKLQKQKFHLKLSQIKSNLVLRIPKQVSDVFGLKKGETVEFGLNKNFEFVIKVNKKD